MLLGDYSGDVQGGAALERIQEFGRDKGISIKERSTLPDLPEWPQEPISESSKKTNNKELLEEEIKDRFNGRYAQVLDCTPIAEEDRDEQQGKTYMENGIRYNKRHQPQAMEKTTMIYMPLLPNACQPSYDPSTATFSSSYNLVWTEEQVRIFRNTSRANVVSKKRTRFCIVNELILFYLLG